tara:strand:+ start:210 stop:368 length:159 start_codon:yes stop_codon:yes gene_type:complete
MLIKRIITPKIERSLGNQKELIKDSINEGIAIYMFFQEGPSPDSGGTQLIVW